MPAQLTCASVRRKRSCPRTARTASLPKHISESDCLERVPKGWPSSGASMSVKRTFTWRRSIRTVIVSPSCTDTTFPRTSSAAAGEMERKRRRSSARARLKMGPPYSNGPSRCARFLVMRWDAISVVSHQSSPRNFVTTKLRHPVARQRRVLREIALDARKHGFRHLLLVGVAAQLALLLRIADEGGFHQDRGNVGRLEHCEASLLHDLLVQGIHSAELAQHRARELEAVVDLRRQGEVGESHLQVAVLALEVDAADHVGVVFLLGKPAGRGGGRTALREREH